MNKHCCNQMDEALSLDCKVHSDEFECPDKLLTYYPKFDEFGLIIHDGGTSSIRIKFCPWCGSQLPDSKRDLWFDTLENLGYDDPSEEVIPKDFESEEWYSNDKYV